MRRIYLLMFLVLIMAGCNEKQLAQADQVAADVNSAVTTGQALLSTPAGQALPPDWRLVGSLVLAAGSIAVGAYERWRLIIMSKTTKAIVKGVESAEEIAGVNPTNPVKRAIAREMRAVGVYDRGNQIVDRLKIAR